MTEPSVIFIIGLALVAIIPGICALISQVAKDRQIGQEEIERWTDGMWSSSTSVSASVSPSTAEHNLRERLLLESLVERAQSRCRYCGSRIKGDDNCQSCGAPR
jgi:hypothetical protein